MVTMENWRERMSEDMRLRDLRPRTVDSYLLAVRLFLERVGKSPERLTENHIRAYILHLRDDRRQAPSSINGVYVVQDIGATAMQLLPPSVHRPVGAAIHHQKPPEDAAVGARSSGIRVSLGSLCRRKTLGRSRSQYRPSSPAMKERLL